ncbi:uncharacterized protein DNG_09535 [Cephalotrichum gorgonifer]|uniref:Uncharacterized protein n=1 Tax=Cephalotrichum gorgonifer TaxID=2041049 RepID=A0AAE8SZD9_9PEZI|nr:uncharacterized protein DNG_09535 [Cephalotrichum gorgonifer]
MAPYSVPEGPTQAPALAPDSSGPATPHLSGPSSSESPRPAFTGVNRSREIESSGEAPTAAATRAASGVAVHRRNPPPLELGHCDRMLYPTTMKLQWRVVTAAKSEFKLAGNMVRLVAGIRVAGVIMKLGGIFKDPDALVKAIPSFPVLASITTRVSAEGHRVHIVRVEAPIPSGDCMNMALQQGAVKRLYVIVGAAAGKKSAYRRDPRRSRLPSPLNLSAQPPGEFEVWASHDDGASVRRTSTWRLSATLPTVQSKIAPNDALPRHFKILDLE